MDTHDAARVAHQGEAMAGRAVHGPWGERFARAGLISRAVNYLVLSILVALVAIGRGGREADSRGAILAVAGAPLGHVLLLVLCVGVAAFIAWQLLRAGTRRRDQGGAPDWTRRLNSLGTAIIYGGLLATIVKSLVGAATSSPQRSQASWTAALLASSVGRLLVGLTGVGLVVAGVVLFVYGMARKFEDVLDTGSMSPRMRRATTVLGVTGQGARGLVFVIIGGFVLSAALSEDAAQSKGLDASLRTLAGAPFGPLVLGVVALGFFAYGVYSLIDARYRRDFSG